ncbi:MAG: hypothetical protein KDD51_01020 [Bdellovibrionales bacterium]|nr:hypothetical protein [Bdellovibrionales bacterium]
MQRSTLLFIGACVFVFFVRAYFIILPAAVMKCPRLGDDSLFYLSKGYGFFTRYGEGSPLRASFKNLLETTQTKNEASLRQRWRISNQITGTLNPMYDLLTGLVLKIGLPVQWSFAVMELCCALLMTVGIAYFLSGLFGVAAAGLASVSLGFAILPNQGLHYFIPSTFTLSLALIGFGYLLRPRTKLGDGILVASSFYFGGLHLISRAYLGLAIAILWLVSETPRRRKIGLTVTFLASAWLWWFLPKHTLFFSPPLASDLGGIAGADSIIENFHVASVMLAATLRKNLWLLLGLLLLLQPREIPRKTRLTTVLFTSLLLVSLFHVLPRYPAETFSRLLVLIVILGSGLMGSYVVDRVQSSRLRWPLAVLVTGALGLSMGHWNRTLYSNMNERQSVLDAEALKKTLKSLPSHSSLLYAETEIALRFAMAYGASQFAGLPYPMLAGSDDLSAHFKKASADYTVVPNFEHLNVIDALGIATAQRRRHGFPAQWVQTLELSGVLPAHPLLYIENANAEVEILVQGQRLERVVVPAGFEGWMALSDLGSNPKSLVITLPKTGLWVSGLRSESQARDIRWPWSTPLRVRAKGYPEFAFELVYDFSLAGILKHHGAQELIPFEADSKVLSDGSGLVFWTRK